MFNYTPDDDRNRGTGDILADRITSQIYVQQVQQENRTRGGSGATLGTILGQIFSQRARG